MESVGDPTVAAAGDSVLGRRGAGAAATLVRVGCYTAPPMGDFWKLATTVLTAWPPWIALVAVVFILVFRANIRDLFGRITGIGRTGITTATATTMKDAQASPAPDPRASAEELIKALDNAYVREVEDRIGQELEKRGLKPGVPETTRVLTRYTAAALVNTDFEHIENNIWGSQIEILEELNGVAKAPADRLRPFYDRAATVYPEVFNTYSFDAYMAFLIGRVFVIRQNGDFVITVKGRAYLMWRVHNGKTRRLG